MTRFRKKKSGKFHKRHPGYTAGNDGKEKILSEPIPEYFSRPGDGVISAKTFGGIDNNASIIFGRDRTGVGEKYKSDSGSPDTLGVGSYGDYMAAGAIDIVVGRMAPYPVNLEGFSVGPLYKTIKNAPALALESLEGEDENGPFEAPHPMFAMDAARIYISQMTDVDENFGIETNLRAPPRRCSQKAKALPGTAITPPPAGIPYSAIMIKSDKIRLHSREDIKIVTGGPGESHNSQGEPIISTGGIHLMAGNEESKQQPIPLGDNLESCLTDIIDALDQFYDTFYMFIDRQMKYNDVLAKHTHLSPFYGLECTFSPTGAPEGVKTVLDQFRYAVSQLNGHKNRLQKIQSTYLSIQRGTQTSGCYINSRYNTTN